MSGGTLANVVRLVRGRFAARERSEAERAATIRSVARFHGLDPKVLAAHVEGRRTEGERLQKCRLQSRRDRQERLDELRRLRDEGVPLAELARRFRSLSKSRICELTRGSAPPRPRPSRLDDEGSIPPAIAEDFAPPAIAGGPPLPPVASGPAVATRPRWPTARAPAVGSEHGRAKLTEADVIALRRLRAEGMSLTALARRFGICRNNVMAILRGQTWKHVR
jgi:hypothetical protein